MRFSRACVLFALCWATTFSAFAESVRIEELTSPELRSRIAAGTTTVIVPIGGTEQNGPHMVLGKHNVRVATLAEQIARELGNAVVAPVVSYVPDEGHMRFAGTISIDDAAFESLLVGAARSFRRHGIRDVVFIGDHGGYQKNLERAAAKLNREWQGSPARAHALLDYYRVTETKYAEQLRQRGFTAAEIGTHAGLGDTSYSLAVDKSLVRNDTLARTAPDKDGVHGDPRRANSELGQLAVRDIVETSVAEIRRVTRR